MTGNKGNILSQGPEFFRDRPDQRIVIAKGKVSATDRALKQQVADNGEFRRPIEKATCPGV